MLNNPMLLPTMKSGRGGDKGDAVAKVTWLFSVPSLVESNNVRSQQEVDAVRQEAAQAGATIIKPAQLASWGGYPGYFANLDGHLWEVAWNPFLEID